MDFLAEACAGDSALRIEVQELLDNAEETTSLLDTEPCGRILPQRPHSSPPIFAPGDVVGQRYEVIRFIAKGGMGEVYEVEDGELKTRVALKTIAHSLYYLPISSPGSNEKFN